jgi:hypothetical protein
VVLRLKLRAFTLSHSISPIFFEIGSRKLFAQTVFKL